MYLYYNFDKMIDRFDWWQEEIKKMKENRDTKEELDSILASVVYEDFLKSVAEVKVGKDWKEKDEKIKKIRNSFTKEWVIVYQDETWWIREEKNIEGFLNRVSKWEVSIDFSIDVDQYVKEWAISLETSKWENWIDNIKIKRVQLNADYLK